MKDGMFKEVEETIIIMLKAQLICTITGGTHQLTQFIWQHHTDQLLDTLFSISHVTRPLDGTGDIIGFL